MRKEYNVKKLEPKKRDLEKSKNLKIATNVRLDIDVVAWLKDEADRLAIPYQTLLNSKLKQCMTQAQDALTRDQIRAIVREEIQKAV